MPFCIKFKIDSQNLFSGLVVQNLEHQKITEVLANNVYYKHLLMI